MALPVCEECSRSVRTVFFNRGGRGLCKFCLEEEKIKDWKKDSATHMRRDEYPGGITLENYGEKPVTFYSESERIAYLKREGLEQRERWAPLPGTDRDPAGVQDSNKYKDPYTLNAARELMLRAAGIREQAQNDAGFDSSRVMRVHVGSETRALVIMRILESQRAREASRFGLHLWRTSGDLKERWHDA